MEHHQNGNEGQQGGAEQIQAATEAAKPEHHHRQQQPGRSCPRCSSTNTKFCYYNNYIQSQPRYFCKDCRRYWTHGGSLRNVPIGGSFRKYKRPGRPRATLPSASPHLPSTQLIVPSPSLLTSSFSAPCYNPTSFYSGGGGAGIFSSWMGPQPMNQMPETLPSNMGNLLHVSDAKPFGLTGFLPPGAGSSTTMAAGVGGSQDISDLKLHHDLFDNVGNVGDIHDQLV